MITQIGIVAGEIWNHLEKNPGTNDLEGIIKEIDKPKDLVLMSIGWLAREGHIVLEGESPSYSLKLREKKK